MDQRISLITLGASDLGRAVRFYEKLGWKRGNRDESVAFFQLPGCILALWSRVALANDSAVSDDGGSFGGVVLAYNARSKAEVDAVMAEVAAAGATITKPAQDVFWGGYSGYFRDPEGHLWEVAWNPGWHIGPDGAVTLSASEA